MNSEDSYEFGPNAYGVRLKNAFAYFLSFRHK